MGSLYLGGPTIQEVDGKMKMGLSIYGVAVISESLYSRFYCIHILTKRWLGDNWLLIKLLLFRSIISRVLLCNVYTSGTEICSQ